MGSSILTATSANILAASRKVKDGGLIVYPTDTVYGFGCDPFNPDAIKRVFDVKSERKKPLPILASDLEAVERIASLSEKARRIADTFWPGPLTIVVPKKPILPDLVTCRLNSVGVRVPGHDVALELIRLSDGVLTGTSANKTGQKPPLTAQEASKQIGSEVDLILNGGLAALGISSTVIDLTAPRLRILRKGPISLREITAVLSQE
jgi:L-threonylcarbamoyladenylate synthase